MRQQLPNPAPSPEMCVRPAPPIQLSMLSTSNGTTAQPNPLMLVRMGTPALRKVVQKPLFDIADETVYLIRPPTQLMRLIDSLRFHKPTLDERVELNLCSSTERLSLHTLTDLLLACGGRKGFRFTSNEINHLRQNADDIVKRYETLDSTFKALPLEATQYKFPTHIRRIEDEPALYQELSNSACDQRNRSQEETIRWRAFELQKLARDYVNSYSRLRETAQAIRLRFQSYLTQQLAVSNNEILQVPVEAEFEAKQHRPFPMFIYHLIQKYHHDQRNKSTKWMPSCPEPPVESIGTFCVFLVHVLLDDGALTQDELHSFEVLLQVLKLSFRVDVKQLRIRDIAHPSHSTHSRRAKARGGSSLDTSHLVTNTTLCHMLYEFLSTVRELRLVPKQKKLLPLPRTPRRAASRTSVNRK